MNIAFVSSMPKEKYSGGRYHAYAMALCLASQGNKVYLFCDNKPVFEKDFKDYIDFSNLNVILCPYWEIIPVGIALDYVVMVPDQSKNVQRYNLARNLALCTGAKLVLINYESGNWFNELSPQKRDEAVWLEWKRASLNGCMYLSSANESMRYAQKYYDLNPSYTRFDVWNPPINTFVADSVDEIKENIIVVITRMGDAHKGGRDVLDILDQSLQGYSVEFIISDKLDDCFSKRLEQISERNGFNYHIRNNIDERSKFEILKKAKYMLFPSFFEGYGLPPVEAMYSNCLCIAYDLPVLREICGNGLEYCEAGNVEDMKKRLQILIEEKVVRYDLRDLIYEKADFMTQAKKLQQLLLEWKKDDWRDPNAERCCPLFQDFSIRKKTKRIAYEIAKTVLGKPKTKIIIEKADYDAKNKVLLLEGVALACSPGIEIRIVLPSYDYTATTSVKYERADTAQQYNQKDKPICGWKTEIICFDDLIDKEVKISAYWQGVCVASQRTIVKESMPFCIKHVEGDKRFPGKPYIVMVSHIIPFPNIQGNRVYINQLMEHINKSQKYNLIIVLQVNWRDAKKCLKDLCNCCSELFVADLELQEKVNSRREKYSNIDRYYQGTEDALKYIANNYNLKAAIAQYVHLVSSLEVLPPKVTRIVYTHDVLSRFAEIEKAGIVIEENRKCTVEEEAYLLNKADIIVAITPVEQKILKEMCPTKQVICIGMYVSHEEVHSVPSGNKVLFFASGNPLNERGVREFLEKVWPRISEEVEAEFVIIGSICNKLQDVEGKYTNVYLKGIVSDEALKQAICDAKVVINCTDLGTGLKIKTIEALSYGKALVSTKKGVEGIDYDANAKPFIEVDEWDDFAEAVITLLENQEDRKILEERAKNFTKEYLGEAHIFGPLDHII